MFVIASESKGPGFSAFMRERISCSRMGARSAVPLSFFKRPTSSANSVRRFKRCSRAVSIASIFLRQSSIFICSSSLPFFAPDGHKKSRALGEVRGRYSKLFALLVTALIRARLARPLPPPEEAVRKGEFAAIHAHGAGSIPLRSKPSQQLQRKHTKSELHRQALPRLAQEPGPVE